MKHILRRCFLQRYVFCVCFNLLVIYVFLVENNGSSCSTFFGLLQVDNEDECISFDLRPSDAINIAVRCKVRYISQSATPSRPL